MRILHVISFFVLIQSVEILAQNPDWEGGYLTEYTGLWGKNVVKKAWELGDLLWTNYDEKF